MSSLKRVDDGLNCLYTIWTLVSINRNLTQERRIIFFASFEFSCTNILSSQFSDHPKPQACWFFVFDWYISFSFSWGYFSLYLSVSWSLEKWFSSVSRTYFSVSTRRLDIDLQTEKPQAETRALTRVFKSPIEMKHQAQPWRTTNHKSHFDWKLDEARSTFVACCLRWTFRKIA